MPGLCLYLASGLLAATVPTERFTLSWQHSVEKIEWRETYEVAEEGLLPVEAAVRGSGAGMEPPEGAVFTHGWWRYKPALPTLPSLTLARSPFTADYRLCWGGQCRPLGELVSADAGPTVTILRGCKPH